MDETDDFSLTQLYDTISRSKESFDIFGKVDNFTLSQYLDVYEGRPSFNMGIQPFDTETSSGNNMIPVPINLLRFAPPVTETDIAIMKTSTESKNTRHNTK